MTQYDTDSNFPKILMFGEVHYGLLSNRKIKSKGKTYMYGRINFKNGVNDVSNKEQRDIAHFFIYMLFWFIWLMEGKIIHKSC